MNKIFLERKANWGSHFSRSGSKVLMKNFPWLFFSHKSYQGSFIKPIYENSIFRYVIGFFFGWLVEDAFSKKNVFYINEGNYAHTREKDDTIVIDSYCENSDIELQIIEMVKEFNDRMED